MDYHRRCGLSSTSFTARPLPRRPSQAARKKIGAGAAAGNRVIEIETGIEIVNATETTTATAAAEEEAPIVSVEDPGAMTVDTAMAVAGVPTTMSMGP